MLIQTVYQKRFVSRKTRTLHMNSANEKQRTGSISYVDSRD